MKGYFSNPEIKESSAVLLIVMFVFITCSYFIIKVNNVNLKRNYIKVMGSVAARVAEKNRNWNRR